MTDKVPYGIAYPIQRGSTGYFEPTYDSATSAKNSLRNFLLTRPGSRPGRPEYGSRLWKIAFENNTNDINDVAEDILTDEIEARFPNLIISSINVERTSDDIDIYRVGVEIRFTMRNVNSVEILNVDISL